MDKKNFQQILGLIPVIKKNFKEEDLTELLTNFFGKDTLTEINRNLILRKKKDLPDNTKLYFEKFFQDVLLVSEHNLNVELKIKVEQDNELDIIHSCNVGERGTTLTLAEINSKKNFTLTEKANIKAGDELTYILEINSSEVTTYIVDSINNKAIRKLDEAVLVGSAGQISTFSHGKLSDSSLLEVILNAIKVDKEQLDIIREAYLAVARKERSIETEDVYHLDIDSFPELDKIFIAEGANLIIDEQTSKEVTGVLDKATILRMTENPKYKKSFQDYLFKTQEELQDKDTIYKTRHQVKSILKKKPGWSVETITSKGSMDDQALEAVIEQQLRHAILVSYDSLKKNASLKNPFKVMTNAITKTLLDVEATRRIFDGITDGIRFDYAYYREITRTFAELEKVVRDNVYRRLPNSLKQLTLDIIIMLANVEYSNFINFTGTIREKRVYAHVDSKIDSYVDVLNLLQCERLVSIIMAFVKTLRDIKELPEFKGRQRMSKSAMLEVMESRRMLLSAKINEIHVIPNAMNTVLKAICVKEYNLVTPISLQAPDIFTSSVVEEMATIAQFLFPAITDPKIIIEALGWTEEPIHVRENIERFYHLFKNSEFITEDSIAEFKNKFSIRVGYDDQRSVTSAFFMKNQKAEASSDLFAVYAGTQNSSKVALTTRPYKQASTIFSNIMKPFEVLADSKFLVETIDAFTRLMDGFDMVMIHKSLQGLKFSSPVLTGADLLAISFQDGRFTLGHEGTTSQLLTESQRVFEELGEKEATELGDLTKEYESLVQHLPEMRKELLSATGHKPRILYTINVTGKRSTAIPEIRTLSGYYVSDDALQYIILEHFYNYQDQWNGTATKVYSPLIVSDISELAYYTLDKSFFFGISADIPVTITKKIFEHEITVPFDPRAMTRLAPLEGSRFFDNSHMVSLIHTNVKTIKDFISYFRAGAQTVNLEKQLDIVINDKIRTQYIELVRTLLSSEARVFLSHILSYVFKEYSLKENKNINLLRGLVKQRIANETAISLTKYFSFATGIIGYDDIDYIVEEIEKSHQYALGDDLFNLKYVE